MAETHSKRYDLEERTFFFARQIRDFAIHLPRTVANIEDCKQLIRGSGSVGANYIEANESLGRKDFLMHIKICRKEAKECRYWLLLLDVGSHPENAMTRDKLLQEAQELTSIFGAILRNSE